MTLFSHFGRCRFVRLPYQKHCFSFIGRDHQFISPYPLYRFSSFGRFCSDTLESKTFPATAFFHFSREPQVRLPYPVKHSTTVGRYHRIFRPYHRKNLSHLVGPTSNTSAHRLPKNAHTPSERFCRRADRQLKINQYLSRRSPSEEGVCAFYVIWTKVC